LPAAVNSRLDKGDLKLHGWVYKIETGEVFAFEPHSGQFVPLAEYLFPSDEDPARQRTSHAI
jgi:carbonic anhydrase